MQCIAAATRQPCCGNCVHALMPLPHPFLPNLHPPCRRLLASPDMDLVQCYDQPCKACNSGEKYYKCCGWKVEADQGGVLWPMYHLCE